MERKSTPRDRALETGEEMKSLRSEWTPKPLTSAGQHVGVEFGVGLGHSVLSTESPV